MNVVRVRRPPIAQQTCGGEVCDAPAVHIAAADGAVGTALTPSHPKVNVSEAEIRHQIDVVIQRVALDAGGDDLWRAGASGRCHTLLIQ